MPISVTLALFISGLLTLVLSITKLSSVLLLSYKCSYVSYQHTVSLIHHISVLLGTHYKLDNIIMGKGYKKVKHKRDQHYSMFST